MTIVACDDEQNVKETQDPLKQDQPLLKLETQESIQPKIEQEPIQLQIPDQQQVSEFVLYQDGEFLTLVPQQQQQGLPVKAVDRVSPTGSLLLPRSAIKSRTRASRLKSLSSPAAVPSMSSVNSNYLCKTCGFSSGDRKLVTRHVRAVHEIGGAGGEGRGRKRRAARRRNG